jgi:hypothetical protein
MMALNFSSLTFWEENLLTCCDDYNFFSALRIAGMLG